jgi:hypothetical protein
MIACNVCDRDGSGKPTAAGTCVLGRGLVAYSPGRFEGLSAGLRHRPSNLRLPYAYPSTIAQDDTLRANVYVALLTHPCNHTFPYNHASSLKLQRTAAGELNFFLTKILFSNIAMGLKPIAMDKTAHTDKVYFHQPINLINHSNPINQNYLEQLQITFVL